MKAAEASNTPNTSTIKKKSTTGRKENEDPLYEGFKSSVKELLTSKHSVGKIYFEINNLRKELEIAYGKDAASFSSYLRSSLASIIRTAKNTDEINKVFNLANYESTPGNSFLSSGEISGLRDALSKRLEKAIKAELANGNKEEGLLASEIEKQHNLEGYARSLRKSLENPPSVHQPNPKSLYLNWVEKEPDKEPVSAPTKPDFTVTPPVKQKDLATTTISKTSPVKTEEADSWNSKVFEREFKTDEDLIKFLIDSSSAGTSSSALYNLLSNSGKGFQKLADDFLDHMTSTYLDEAAFDKTAQNILDELKKIDTVQTSEIKVIKRQLDNAKLEITLGQIFNTIIPKDESAANYRLVISKLLSAELPVKSYEENLELLKQLTEIKNLGGKAELSLLQDLLSTKDKKSTMETIEKRLCYFKDIQTLLTDKKIDIPETLLFNPDNEKEQTIVSKAVSFKAHEKHIAISYLTFEACNDANFKKLAEEFDLMVNKKTEPDYQLRAQIVDFLNHRSSGHKNTEDDLAAERFMENLVELMKQKDPKTPGSIIGIFGAKEMFSEVYKTHIGTKTLSKSKTFSEFVGHYWNVEKALELMGKGKYIVGISFRTYEDLNDALDKTSNRLSIKVTTRPDLKGELHSDIDVSFDRTSKREKVHCRRELDLVYIDGHDLNFGETKTSHTAEKLSDEKNGQSYALDEIAKQYGLEMKKFFKTL